MQNFTDQITAFWGNLDESRRRVLVLAVVAALTCIIGVGIWAGQPSWVAMSHVSDDDARQSVVDDLSRSGIQWRIGQDGETVEVLAGTENEARRTAAGEHGLVGLEGVDQLNPWVTPFQEQLQKQRMLQNELARAINGIDGIEKSSVHLNIRPAQDFLTDRASSSAAVTVKSDEGAVLPREIGRTIARLVSHSVAGMTEEEVSVIDQRTGRALWTGDKLDEAELSVSDMAQKKGERLAAQATEALAAVLGSPDRVRISVSVDLVTASTQSTVNAVDPDTVAALREKSESDANTTSTGEASGEPGVQSNQPQAAVTQSSSGNTRKREETDTTYAVTTSQTTTIQPAGEIKRISAAVYVDSAAVATLAKSAGSTEDVIKAELQKSVLAAIGASEKRGDSVVVSFVPFAEAELSSANIAPAVPWERLSSSAVAMVAVILTFAFLIRPLMRHLSPPAPVTVAARNTDGSSLDTQIGDDGEPLPHDENVIDLASRLRAQVDNYRHVSAEDVSALVRRETDHSAEVLRRWIRS